MDIKLINGIKYISEADVRPMIDKGKRAAHGVLLILKHFPDDVLKKQMGKDFDTLKKLVTP